MSELPKDKAEQSSSERTIELFGDSHHILNPIYKIKLDDQRYPSLPRKDNTLKIGYSRGLYDKFIPINFGHSPEYELDSIIDVKSLGFEMCEKTLQNKLNHPKYPLQIEDKDLCFGDDLKDIIKCAVCKNIVIEPIKECV